MAASHERLTIESGRHARHGILHVPSLLIFRVREASCRVPKRIVDGCEESTTFHYTASRQRHASFATRHVASRRMGLDRLHESIV
jgi:hypothetical protein